MTKKKLALAKETIAALNLKAAAGGWSWASGCSVDICDSAYVTHCGSCNTCATTCGHNQSFCMCGGGETNAGNVCV